MEVKLGEIITQSVARKDAVHVAVAPVVAGEELSPGEHIGLRDDGAATSDASECIGIVDPFLSHGPRRGQKFWMFLYPKTVQNLRHDWDHPAIDNRPEPEIDSSDDEAEWNCRGC